jgi:hypothetical protein
MRYLLDCGGKTKKNFANAAHALTESKFRAVYAPCAVLEEIVVYPRNARYVCQLAKGACNCASKSFRAIALRLLGGSRRVAPVKVF